MVTGVENSVADGIYLTRVFASGTLQKVNDDGDNDENMSNDSTMEVTQEMRTDWFYFE